MGMRVHEADLATDVRRLLSAFEHGGHAIVERGGLAHEPHPVGVVQMLVDDRLVTPLARRIEQSGDDRSRHGNEAVADAGMPVIGVDERHGHAVTEGDVPREHPVEDEITSERRVYGLGLLTEGVGEPLGRGITIVRQPFAQGARGLIQQGDGPGGGHVLLHRGLRRLQGVVPIPFAVTEQRGARDPVGADVVERAFQVVGDRRRRLARPIGLRIPEADRTPEQGVVAGGTEILGHGHERPYRDVAVGIVLVHRRVGVKHEPLRQGAVGVLMREDLEQNLAHDVVVSERERRLERPLAHVPCAPRGPGILFKSMRGEEVDERVLHEPRHDEVELAQPTVTVDV